MLQKIYLHLLILCGNLYHGIFATLSNVDARESSDLLVRGKRVVSHLPNGLISIRIDQANYMVNIKQKDRFHCAGSILTRHIVITAASCLSLSISHYQVLSGSSDDRSSTYHLIKSKLTHYGNFPHGEYDGIALITVDPPFVYSPKTGNISLYAGFLLAAGTRVTISGWGCAYPINSIPAVKRRLRTITVPIMKHDECQKVYLGHFNITDKHICTYDVNQHCAHRDEGAPLVFNYKIAGIHIWKGEIKGQKNPDVFLNLQRSDYVEWIREHSILM